MKAMRLITRKATRPKEEGSAFDWSEAAPTPRSSSRYDDKRRTPRLTPRNLHRVRSHSLARSRRREVTPRASQLFAPEETDTSEQTPIVRNNSREPKVETPVAPRKSNEWKTITGELHRRMQENARAFFEEECNKDDPPPHHHHRIEISPMAKSILDKKDRQRRAIKTSESLVSGQSKSTHHTRNSASARSDRRMTTTNSRQRGGGTRKGPPRLTEINTDRIARAEESPRKPYEQRTQSVAPPMDDELENMAIYDMPSRPTKQDATVIKDEANAASKTQSSHTSRGSSNTKYRSKSHHQADSPKIVPSRNPTEPAKRRHVTSQGRSFQQTPPTPTTPVLRRKKGSINAAPVTCDRSVMSRASSKAQSTKALSTKATPPPPPSFISTGIPNVSSSSSRATMTKLQPVGGEKTMQLSMEVVQTLLAEHRMTVGREDDAWEGSTDAGGEGEASLASASQKNTTAGNPSSNNSSALHCMFACTNPQLESTAQTEPALAREMQQMMWLEYAKQSIHEAKQESNGQGSNKSRMLSPTVMRVLAPPMVESITESEDSGVVEDYSEEDDDDARSISSVDLLMKWIGNCGEPPDLRDHLLPPTQREQLALHEAARTPRGYHELLEGR